MTTRTDPPSPSARTAASSARTPTASASCWPTIAAPRATTERDRAAGQPRHRPRPLRLDVRRQARVAKRPSRRRSPGSGRTTGSASSSTTTSSTSSSRRRQPRPRRAAAPIERLRDDRGPRQHEPRRGLAARLRAGRRPPRRAGRQPLPAPHRRPRQRRITDPASSRRHAAELRARGVSTSTFGVGNDFDERLLQELADAGGGHFYYIADAPQIRDAITSEVGETLEIVARDVDARGHGPRRHPDRADQPVPGGGARQPDDRRRSATSAPSRSSRSCCGCRSRTATSAARPGVIVVADRSRRRVRVGRRRPRPSRSG